jgi:hypothetical protein
MVETHGLSRSTKEREHYQFVNGFDRFWHKKFEKSSGQFF